MGTYLVVRQPLQKGIGKALGITSVINSPTFTILKTYQGTKNTKSSRPIPYGRYRFRF